MKLDKQCCDLDKSKNLKDLGILQDSLFYHNTIKNEIVSSEYKKFAENIYQNYSEKDSNLSAYTTAELGAMLPCRVYIGREQYNLKFQKFDDCWRRDKVQSSDFEKNDILFWYQYDFLNDDNKIIVYNFI